jgi:hypothetical protein
MTEVVPITGRTCSQRHRHHDAHTGHTEALDLRTDESAAPGALSTITITPTILAATARRSSGSTPVTWPGSRSASPSTT